MKILTLLYPLVGAKNIPFEIDENSPVRFITRGVFLDVKSSFTDIFGKLRTYHKKVLVDHAKLPEKVLKAIKAEKLINSQIWDLLHLRGKARRDVSLVDPTVLDAGTRKDQATTPATELLYKTE